MAHHHSDPPDELEKRDFSVVRKGYDKDEVHTYLMKVDAKVRDLALRAQDAKVRLEQTEYELGKLKSEQSQSIDTAIATVLDAKDRILERARKQADQIHEDARQAAKEDLEAPSAMGAEIIAKAQQESTAILEAAELRVAEIAGEASDNHDQLEEITKQRDDLVAHIEELESESSASMVAAREEVDAAEARAIEILTSAEGAAESIRERLERDVSAASADSAEASENADIIIADAEESAQALIALAEEASENSRSAASEAAEMLISKAQEEAEATIKGAEVVAAKVRDDADEHSESTKDEAEQLLKNAVAAAEARTAEIVVREAELEQLAAMAATAEEEAAETLSTARGGAEALREEAQELRDEADGKRTEAQGLVDEARRNIEAGDLEIAEAREELATDLKEIEGSIAIKNAEAADAEDAFVDAKAQLEGIRSEIGEEEQRLVVARTAVKAELEDLKVDMAELREATVSEVEAMQLDMRTHEGSSDDAITAAMERAAQIVAKATERAAQIEAGIGSAREEAVELAAAESVAEAESVLAEARADADRIVTEAEAEAERIGAVAADTLTQASEADESDQDPADIEAMLADIVAREWEIGRRERALADREDSLLSRAATSEAVGLAAVPAGSGIGPDGWPTEPSSATRSVEGDSIDAIRREAMAALDESRLENDWSGEEVAGNGTKGAPTFDYSPSVPHAPKQPVATDEVVEHEVVPVESRYRRNSAKLPRIGIKPGSSSDSIAKLRKMIVSGD